MFYRVGELPRGFHKPSTKFTVKNPKIELEITIRQVCGFYAKDARELIELYRRDYLATTFKFL